MVEDKLTIDYTCKEAYRNIYTLEIVNTELAEENQKVKGIIIGLEDDLKLKRALSVTQNIDFYKYQVSFKLFKG